MIDLLLYTIYILLFVSTVLVVWSLIHQYVTRDK